MHRRPRPLNQPIPCRTRNCPARKRKKGHGRRPIPDHLPRTDVLHDVPPEERVCDCGREKVRIGEDVTEQLEYEPGKLFVFRHIYPKYACSCCKDGVTSAPAGGQSDRGGPGWARTAGVRHCQQVLRSPAAVSPAGRAVPPRHLPGAEHALRLVGPVCTGTAAVGRVDAKASCCCRL